MRSHLYIFIVGPLTVLAAAYVSMTLSMGLGMGQIFRLAAVLVPFIAILLIAARKHWLALMLIAWTASMRIPIVPLDAVTVGFFCMAGVCVFYVMERLMTRKPFFKVDHWSIGLLLAAGALLVIRFGIDRPGSARMGSGGGLRNAVAYTAAIPLFFVTAQLAREPFEARKIIRAVFIIALLVLGWRVGVRFLGQSTIPLYFGWYERSVWFIMPMTLAWLIRKIRQKGSSLLPALLFCLFFLLLAVLSPFRSRIYFAVASIAAVFWCFGYHRRLAMAMAILGCIAVPLLMFLPKEVVPAPARRALSTVLPYDWRDVPAQDLGIGSSEMGWGSGFRRSLNQVAVRQIRQTPLFGQGWTFSAAEIEWAAGFAGLDWTSSGLVVAGDYHNSVLTVAVKGGLPAAILLSIALAALLTRSVAWSSRIPDGWQQTLYAGMTGAIAALFGQMLMNGTGEDLQAICILLGFFHGTRQRVEHENLRADSTAMDAKEERKRTTHE